MAKVWVPPYQKKDGTNVAGHYRTGATDNHSINKQAERGIARIGRAKMKSFISGNIKPKPRLSRRQSALSRIVAKYS